MSSLLARLLLIIVLLAAAGATGFIKGALWQANKADDFKSAVQAAGAARAARTKAIDAQHTTITRETHDAHAAGIDLVRAYYARPGGLRQPRADLGTLSYSSGDPGEPRSGSADAEPAAAGTPARIAETDERCAETTLMFLDLRNAWREHLEVAP